MSASLEKDKQLLNGLPVEIKATNQDPSSLPPAPPVLIIEKDRKEFFFFFLFQTGQQGESLFRTPRVLSVTLHAMLAQGEPRVENPGDYLCFFL